MSYHIDHGGATLSVDVNSSSCSQCMYVLCIPMSSPGVFTCLVAEIAGSNPTLPLTMLLFKCYYVAVLFVFGFSKVIYLFGRQKS